MAHLQPFLHDLTGVFSAPIQAWSDPHGQIRGTGAQGIHCGDDRVISSAVLTVDGSEPEWVSAQVRSARRVDFLAMVRVENAGADPLVQLTRTRTASADGIREVVRIDSALDEPVTLVLACSLAADSTPMEKVKAGQGSGTPLAVDALQWNWRNADTTALLDPGTAAVAFGDGRIELRWQVTVDAGSTAEITWSLALQDTGAPMTAPSTAPLEAPAVGDRRLDLLLRHSISDLNGLRMAPADQPAATFLAAGAPWFFTMFGRDSLIAARLLLPVSTELAGSTLTALASRQGTVSDASTAEQPGKILHEVRRGTLRFEEDGTGIALPPVYYGTIDATPLWIMLLHDAWRAGLDDDVVGRLLDPLEKALTWLRDFGDSDGDGFLEYLDTSGHGLANQGWKDSGDSIRWHDGSLAEGPIALSEVQGYAYEAAVGGAALLEAFGRPGAESWRSYAASLAERFREAFWCSDVTGRYPAIALDAQKRAVDGVTSNMGHLLGTGILTAEEEAVVVARLLDPTMFSGFGIRTVSTTNGGFWPTRYHAGSVWSHDTGMIISGMLRAGFTDEAAVLARGLLDAAEGFDWRLPELFSGHTAGEVEQPVPYPASCRPQAWAAASAVPIAQALGAL
ncbi:glycogen debranching N-terminal domain-containing protein [Arthrobacter pityocampae]|uniref:glycogen debranching N-terminal domain-containing protein n=1 Tax=Arthrobacter pityocampae TaxID=547334 RepID=UPI003734F2DC